MKLGAWEFTLLNLLALKANEARITRSARSRDPVTIEPSAHNPPRILAPVFVADIRVLGPSWAISQRTAKLSQISPKAMIEDDALLWWGLSPESIRELIILAIPVLDPGLVSVIPFLNRILLSGTGIAV